MNPDNITPPQPQLPTHQVGKSMKVLLLILAVAIVSTLGYFTLVVGAEQETAEEVAPSVKDRAEETVSAVTAVENCDFTTVSPTLKPGVTFDLGGGEEFDTVVCGYLTTKEENMAMDGDEPLLKNRAYFNVTKFQQAKFKAALDAQIAEGNTVNSAAAGEYQLGCGCSEGGKIISDVGDLTDAISLPKILASTKEKPIIVKLSFFEELGRGCTCCNLLDKIEAL